VVVFRAAGGAPILQQPKVKVRPPQGRPTCALPWPVLGAAAAPRAAAEAPPPFPWGSRCYPPRPQLSADAKFSKLVAFLRKQLKTDSVVRGGAGRARGC
jgi:hypothetical protein